METQGSRLGGLLRWLLIERPSKQLAEDPDPDHLDDRTVRALARDHPNAGWCVPLGLASFFLDRGARRVHELDWWQEREIANLAIACTPAQHFTARTPTDRNRTLWCGWALRAGDRRVFFAGDTGRHPLFPEIGERYGPFDISLMPVGAYEPRWFMRSCT